MKKFNFEKIVVGDFQTNCYICYNENGCVVIDPGDEIAKISEFITKNKLDIKYIINTHGHGDHMGGNSQLKEIFPDILIACHKDEEEMLLNSEKNLSSAISRSIISPKPDILLNDKDILKICDGIEFEIIHTPGHTKGGICLKSDGIIFCGDTIFLESIGRTDLPGGDYNTIINSIREKIFCLEDCKLYPGHGPVTTILHEKKFNPFLN